MKIFNQWPDYFSYKSDSNKTPKTLRAIEKCFRNLYHYPVLITPSGKSALYHICLALGITRNDKILIPEWSSHCIYNALGILGTPTISTSSGKIALVNHKWGLTHQFPEKFKHYFETIIEDSVDSIILGKHGLFQSHGMYEIISLSKLLGLAGGAVVFCQDNQAYKSLKKIYAKHQDVMLAKTVWQEKRKYYIKDHIPYHEVLSNSADPFVASLTKELMTSIGTIAHIYQSALDLLKHRYLRIITLLREKHYPYIFEISNNNPSRIPTVIPLNSKFIEIADFKKSGYQLPIRHFNVTKDIMNPNFQPRIVLPIHVGINDIEFLDFEKILEKATRSI